MLVISQRVIIVDSSEFGSFGKGGILRRIGLYSLVTVACLAVAGLMAAGVVSALTGGDDARVKQANTPTVSETPEPAPETTAEKTQEEPDEEETRKENPEQEEQEDDSWREIAEQRDAQEQAKEEQAEQQPVQTAAPSNAALNLSVPSIGTQNDPVSNSVSESVLSNGAGKLPSTGFPWQQGANTYIAAHVYGYPGTGSWQQFADLPSMSQGDEILLTDSDGTTYEYQVSEILTVAPTDVWVAESTGQTTVSLQTCVGPGWSERLVVRGSLVDTRPA